MGFLDSLSDRFRSWQRERKDKAAAKDAAKDAAKQQQQQQRHQQHPHPSPVASASASAAAAAAPSAHLRQQQRVQPHDGQDEELDFDVLALEDDLDDEDDEMNDADASARRNRRRAADQAHLRAHAAALGSASAASAPQHPRRLSLGEHLRNMSPASSALAAGRAVPAEYSGASSSASASGANNGRQVRASSMQAAAPSRIGAMGYGEDGLAVERKEDDRSEFSRAGGIAGAPAALPRMASPQTDDERLAEMLQQQEYLAYMQEYGELSQEDVRAIEQAAATNATASAGDRRAGRPATPR